MKILCADALAEDLLAPLVAAGHEIVVDAALDADTLVDKLQSDDFEVLVVRSTKVTEAALDANPSLWLVVRAGAGTDNVDKAAASARLVNNTSRAGRCWRSRLALATETVIADRCDAGLSNNSLRIGSGKLVST